MKVTTLSLTLLFFTLSRVHSLAPPLADNNRLAGAIKTVQNSVVECDVQRLGGLLSQASCDNAREKIERSVEWETYSQRPRHGRREDVVLPKRYLSDDGTCAIDIVINLGTTEERADVANGVGISNAAKAIIQSCVAQSSAGGLKKWFTPYGRLVVQITRYNLKPHCYPSEAIPRKRPNVAACSDLLRRMFASTDKQSFVSDGSGSGRGTPTVSQNLPCGFESRLRPKCKLNARFSVPEDKKIESTWFDLWAAGVAINEICVKNGKFGFVDGINKTALSNGLRVIITPP